MCDSLTSRTLMLIVLNYDILLWVEQLWFNLLFPENQGSWSIAVTVPSFKISIPEPAKTFYYKNDQKVKTCKFVFLKNNIHLINTLSILLNFDLKDIFCRLKMITSYLKECSRKDLFIFCFPSIVHNIKCQTVIISSIDIDFKEIDNRFK